MQKRLLPVLFILSSIGASAQSILRHQIDSAIKGYHANIGVAIAGPNPSDTLSFNGNAHYPMQSVFKLPLAMAILDRVDRHKLNLDQKIPIERGDISKMYSPIADKYPNGTNDLTLKDILTYTVSQSDNIGCDRLFKLIGGPAVVQSYLQRQGLPGISIVATEADMHKAWDVQYRNYTSPLAMLRLLRVLDISRPLSQSSTQLLLTLMIDGTRGNTRIRGLLPPDIIVAHKPGTSDTNDKGITAATNDVGIVTFGGGHQFHIVVLVSDSKENAETNDHIIAAIAKLTYDYYKLNR